MTSDGRGRCGSGKLRVLSSERVLEAREVERDIEGLAEDGVRLRGGRAAGPDYTARTQDGIVRWRAAAGIPPELSRATVLARKLDRELCRRDPA